MDHKFHITLILKHEELSREKSELPKPQGKEIQINPQVIGKLLPQILQALQNLQQPQDKPKKGKN